MSTITYRPEVDGLRAIAVTAVVLYHAEFFFQQTQLLVGGFIGVDIFFVISGYLITLIILREASAGKFSFASFYNRRARRILPALFTVIACSIPFAWMYMTPSALSSFSGSALSSLLFSSNFWFMFEDSYWEAHSSLKPLLHTWSLAVEEQFYLFFPPLLLLCLKFWRRHLMAIMGVGIVLSLILAQYGSVAFPDANFYMLPTRGWELLAGAVLAKLEIDRGRAVKSKWLSTIMPITGLALVLIAIIFFNDTTVLHPSIITALPVAGTVMLIRFCGNGDPVSWLLSSRPFVGLGLISYSFYLWHFPVFAFARIKSDFPLTAVQAWLLIGVALVLSIISYFLIEQPARKRSFISTRIMVSALGVFFVALVAGNAMISVNHGYPARLGPIGDIIEASDRDKLRQDGRICHARPLGASCIFENGSSARSLITVADSHGDVLGVQLLQLAEDKGWRYEHITQSSCPYVNGAVRLNRGQPLTQCNDLQSEMRSYLLNHDPAIIVYTARFPLYLSGKGFDNGEGGVEGRVNDLTLVAGEDQAAAGETIGDQIRHTIQELLDAGHIVVLIYPVPEVGWDVRQLILSGLEGIPTEPAHLRRNAFADMEITTSYDVYKERTAETREILDGLGKHPGLIRIYPDKLLCDEASGRCYTHDDEHIFYADDDHASPYLAKQIVNSIRRNLDDPKLVNHR